MTLRLKPYPEYKDSGVQWLGEVPAHWDVTRAKRAFALRNGATPASGEPRYWDGSIYWATPEDVGRAHGRLLSTTARTITPEGHAACAATIVPPGSIVVSTRAPIGYAALAAIPVCTNQGCRSLVPRGGRSGPYFLAQFVAARPELQATGRGTTFAELSATGLGAAALADPPLPEQQAIAAFLAHFDRRVNRLIRAKRRMIELLEEQKQAIIQQAVTRGLDPSVPMKDSGVEWFGHCPEAWEALPLRRLVRRVVDGPHVSPAYVDDGIPFISARNVKTDRWALGNAKFISEADYRAFCARVTPELGDVLYTKGGTTGVARAVDLPFPFQVWVHVAVLKPRRDAVGPRFLALALNSAACYQQSQLYTRGATNQDLGLGRMKAIVLPVPPTLREQEAIADHTEAALERVNAAIASARREIELLREYRTRLVADVVTGKLDVRGLDLPPLDEDEQADDIEPEDDTEAEDTDDIEGDDDADE